MASCMCNILQWRRTLKLINYETIFYKRINVYLFFIVFFIASFYLTKSSIDFFIEYSSLTIGLTKALIGILILSVVDDILFKKIDTIEEIKNKNTSYALIYLANAIIIAACISIA